MAKNPSQNSNSPLKSARSVKIGEASKILGLHIDTVRRWEKSGKITPIRTPGGTRLYALDELSKLIPKVSDKSLRSSKKTPSKKELPIKNLNKIYEENIYVHVFNKGVEDRSIFNDEDDSKVFLSYLEDYLTAPKDLESIKKVFTVHGRIFQGTPHQPKNYFNQVELVAYSLMPDHFHLLLHQKIPGSLESFIRSLCTRYSMYFNKKYDRSGALFQGPYKSVKVQGETQLLHLTRYLHCAGGYSSYPEYLGTRKTFWIKPESILSSVDKQKADYKNFVEKYPLDQKEMEIIENMTLDHEAKHLREKVIKHRSKMPEFWVVSSVLFILLVTIGMVNIRVYEAKIHQSLPTSAVLSEKAEPKPQLILKVKINEASSSVNIRKESTTSSKIVSQTKDGDTFEVISSNSDWYEIKIPDGSTGFISKKYAAINEGGN